MTTEEIEREEKEKQEEKERIAAEVADLRRFRMEYLSLPVTDAEDDTLVDTVPAVLGSVARSRPPSGPAGARRPTRARAGAIRNGARESDRCGSLAARG